VATYLSTGTLPLPLLVVLNITIYKMIYNQNTHFHYYQLIYCKKKTMQLLSVNISSPGDPCVQSTGDRTGKESPFCLCEPQDVSVHLYV